MDTQFNLKLADFGWALPLNGINGDGKLNGIEGTLEYMPPE